MSIKPSPAASTIPRLRIEVPLEGLANLTVEAVSFEDELALRGWLRRTHRLDDVAIALGRLLDDLDASDEGAVA